MALFGSNDSNLPVPQVKALSERGYSEIDIKDILRKKGYSEDEINVTLQKALVAKVNGKAPALLTESVQQQSLPPAPVQRPQMPEQKEDSLIHKELESAFGDTNALFGSIGAKQQDLSFEKNEPAVPLTPHEDHQQHVEHHDGYEVDLEPIVEAIVEEKWNDNALVLNDIQERLDNLERLSKGGNKIDDVAQVEYLVKQTQERVEKLEQTLDEVSIKVNSIEKAFKQFIPSLTGNIKALSEAVRHIRMGDQETQQ